MEQLLVKKKTGKKSRTFSFSALPYKTQRNIISVAFLFIPVLLLFIFSYLPAFAMVGYSLTDWDGVSPTKNFVGLKNYEIILQDPTYFQPLFNSLYYMVGSFLQIGLATVIATLLSFKLKGKNFFKGVYFFPSLINSVAIGFIFLFFFQPEGTLDSILKFFGLYNPDILWLGNPKIANVSLTFTSVWRYIGYNIVMFAAAIQSISPDILESANVDGANKFQQFRYIILPGITTILGLQLFLAVSGALTVFEIPYIMTEGGNNTMTFVIQAVNYAFKNQRVGLAAALSLILMIVAIVISALQKLVFREAKL
jgi:ABC-type sugar transport systems, permease components